MGGMVQGSPPRRDRAAPARRDRQPEQQDPLADGILAIEIESADPRVKNRVPRVKPGALDASVPSVLSPSALHLPPSARVESKCLPQEEADREDSGRNDDLAGGRNQAYGGRRQEEAL